MTDISQKQGGWTPGPWFRTEAGWTVRAPSRPYTSASGREMSLRTDVALIHRVGGYPDEREANARLIAAAPDMYEALRMYDVWLALPQDRGGPNGTKGKALDAFIRAKDAALSRANPSTDQDPDQ